MTTESSRIQTLTIMCASLIGASEILRDSVPDRAADWIAIAKRTTTLAEMENLTLPVFPLDDVREAAKPQSMTHYAETMAGSITHFAANYHLAHEIAMSAENAARRTRLTPVLADLSWAGAHIEDWIARALDAGWPDPFSTSEPVLLDLETTIRDSRRRRNRAGRELYEAIGATIVVLHVSPEAILVRDASGQVSLIGHPTNHRLISGQSLADELGIQAFVNPPRPAKLPTCAELRDGATQGPRRAASRQADEHHCHARNCRTACKPEMLMCPRHWRMVPPELQRAVWETYRRGQCDTKLPSREWHIAADAAIRSVAEQEAPRAAPTPVAQATPTGNLLWIDTETTGATTSMRHQIIEIAIAVTTRDGTVIDAPKSVLIALEPWSTQDLRSISVHNIDWRRPEFAANAKPMRKVLERVLARLPGHTIAGHNVQFDAKFISDHCERLKLSQPAELAAKPLCTLAHARRLVKQGLLRVDGCSLTTLRDHFGVGHTAHRAATDLDANIEIYRAMLALESQPLLKTGTQ